MSMAPSTSGEVARLHAQVDAQAAALRAVRKLAKEWQELSSRFDAPVTAQFAGAAAADLLDVLDGTATPKVQP